MITEIPILTRSVKPHGLVKNSGGYRITICYRIISDIQDHANNPAASTALRN